MFDSVSRMSRNADDGFSVYEELYTSTDTYKRVLERNVPMTGVSDI